MFTPYLALLVLAIWIGMALAHAGFWRIEPEPTLPEPTYWPPVTAIMPARDEEACIAQTLHSLWQQDYPGDLRLILVDDHSQDATAEIALRTARESGRETELSILQAAPLPPGWTGKVWAMHHGWQESVARNDRTPYLLFSDADIAHGPLALRQLVCRAEASECDLVSFMVRLSCATAAERLMMPAFVFFFRLLYPFRRVNTPSHPLAGAAGGTMLVRREALERIGGLESIRGELIDDCALARQIKRGGHRIWLSLSSESRSIRQYDRLSEILHMIARTAYTQLRYSPWLLLVCIFGLALTFLSPPLLLLSRSGHAALIGGFAWLLMSLLYLPMVRFYRQSPVWALLLPLTALLYLGGTLLSAWRYYRGQGGQWKGRSQNAASPDL